MKKESLSIHFKNLGLSETATFSDVKKSYRKLAMKYHPDRNQGQDINYAESQFKIVKLSYEALEAHFSILNNTQEPFIFEDITSKSKPSAKDNSYHSHYQKDPYQQYKEQATQEKQPAPKKEQNKNERGKESEKSRHTQNTQQEEIKKNNHSHNTFFNHLLILNTDIFKPILKSNLMEEIAKQALNYTVHNFSDKNKPFFIQFFNLYYPSLSQHKEKYHWLETLSLTQYLSEIIPKISPNKYLNYQQQMKRITSEAISIAFGEYIQSHPLIKHYNTNGNFCIEDVEKKIQNESLYEFFLTPINAHGFKTNLKSIIKQFNIGIHYLSGYSLKKIDYLKILTIYEEKQVLENNVELLFFKDKNICAKIIQETENGIVSISALTSLDNIPLHYFINRFREILNNPQDLDIHFEKLNLFIFKTNKLTLNLNNPVIKIPNALEKLLFSMGFKENSHLAYMPLDIMDNTHHHINEKTKNNISSENNKKGKKNILSYFSKIFR